MLGLPPEAVVDTEASDKGDRWSVLISPRSVSVLARMDFVRGCSREVAVWSSSAAAPRAVSACRR